MLAIEGGPGYGTTDSRTSYLPLLGPLRERRDLLLVDLRGTGLSGALDCKTFRRTVKRYVARAGQCARELGPRRDFYGTGDAVDDVAAVLDALRIRQVDLYGDSYGTYASQAFAARHATACARSCSTAPTGARHRSVARRSGRGDPARAAGGVRRLPRGPGRGRVTAQRAAPRPAVHRPRAEHRGRARAGAGRRVQLRRAGAVRLRQRADVPRPVRRHPQLRGGRPRAAPAAVRREQARPDGVGGPQLLRGRLPRGHLPRLPAAVGPVRAAAAAPCPARRQRRGAAAGALRADQPRGRDEPRLRGRPRLPQLARAARRPAARAARRDLSGGPDARAQRRARQHHQHRAGARGGGALPARDVRGDGEHRPHLGDQRPRRLRGADGAALHPHAQRRRHELRRADRPAAAAPRLPAPRGRRRARLRPRVARLAPRRRRRGANRRRRDPALGRQQQRREPRPARRPLELPRRADRRASASAARASSATSASAAPPPGGSPTAPCARGCGCPAAGA